MISIRAIKEIVAEHYNVKIADLDAAFNDLCPSALQEIVFWLANDLTNYSLEHIGRLVGSCPPIIVFDSIRTVETRIKKNAPLKKEIDQLKKTATFLKNTVERMAVETIEEVDPLYVARKVKHNRDGELLVSSREIRSLADHYLKIIGIGVYR